MKEYNRKTKRWEERKEPTGSLKKPKNCRGGKPHEFELCLPSWVQTLKTFTLADVERYYNILEWRKKTDITEHKSLTELGVRNCFIDFKVIRHYNCIHCGKRKTD